MLVKGAPGVGNESSIPTFTYWDMIKNIWSSKQMMKNNLDNVS